MRLCRYRSKDSPRAGFYLDEVVVPLERAAEAFRRAGGGIVEVPTGDDLLTLVDHRSSGREALVALYAWCLRQSADDLAMLGRTTDSVELLLPVPRPPKLLLLAGNYAEHVREDGSRAEERENTFPYLFMKPPSTTLLDPCARLPLPASSPGHMDWEVELAVIIGHRVRDIDEQQALSAVAGYTVLNDISDRRFRPNPGRTERDWDKFFDWMHGKWHDGSAPCGPCLATPESVSDPQALRLRLERNGEVRQDGSTADQIFSVAAVIAFVSRFVTLEPGDIISTGTPAGVGSTTGTYLRDGDTLIASIPGIGSLTTRIGPKAP